ncbi:hypothetical protein H8K52_03000 [Undibacterium seohonense]|uniref:SURF1-like protein n=1 Tax=Undibacterium seohonense TaxID=1344950 RepID=A0ABR6X036_9BURK|nr:hypothetical protein [Undibacterium seohonense]MBC3806313.1 hypothetical protein [Undibacterium seohonense]
MHLFKSVYVQINIKFFHLVCIVGLLFVPHGIPEAIAQSSEYGRRIEAEMRLSPQDIDRFEKFQPPEDNLKPLNPNQTLDLKTEDWLGNAIYATKDAGPYTLVVTLIGKATAAGDVSTLWNSGWRLGDGAERTASFPGLSKLSVKAGQRVEMTKASQPMRFKESQTIRPLLALVRAKNFAFESMTVQVWSGVGDNSWKDILLSFRWLIGGLVFLLLRWWWVKR